MRETSGALSHETPLTVDIDIRKILKQLGIPEGNCPQELIGPEAPEA